MKIGPQDDAIGSSAGNESQSHFNYDRNNDDAVKMLFSSPLQERMAATFEATLCSVVPRPRIGLIPLIDERLERVNKLAFLYFKHHIPSWPPRLLVRKVLRRLLLSVLGPQVEYNEAVLDCIAEVRVTLQHEVGSLIDAHEKISNLQQKIEVLEDQLQQVTFQTTLHKMTSRAASDWAVRPAAVRGSE